MLYCYKRCRSYAQTHGVFPRAESTSRPSLALSYIGSVTVRHSSNGRQPNWRGARNTFKELSQRAPPVFGRATIRLGISPHSSLTTVAAEVCFRSFKSLVQMYFYSAPQCSHCKRCTSYSNSIRLSVRLSVCLSHAGIKTTARSTVQFALLDSKMCLVL